MATLSQWVEGARPRTLPAATSPVMAGLATTWHALGTLTPGHLLLTLLAAVVALALQVGVNYANDYSDGIRGTDDDRVGPMRLVGSEAAPARAVKLAAFTCFGIAALAGLVIVVTTQAWWLLLVGVACILAAWFYTGGRSPYGYAGLGEVFVFIFFGLVATAGTMFVQVGAVSAEAWGAAVAIGLLSCAVLMVNNIRDLKQDRVAGKRTLAVLVGDRAARILFAVLTLVPFGILGLYAVVFPLAIYVYFALLAGLPAVIITLTGKTAPEFVLALKLTSLTALLFGVGLAAALAF